MTTASIKQPPQRASNTAEQPRIQTLANGLFGQRMSRNLHDHNDNGELAAA